MKAELIPGEGENKPARKNIKDEIRPDLEKYLASEHGTRFKNLLVDMVIGAQTMFVALLVEVRILAALLWLAKRQLDRSSLLKLADKHLDLDLFTDLGNGLLWLIDKYNGKRLGQEVADTIDSDVKSGRMLGHLLKIFVRAKKRYNHRLNEKRSLEDIPPNAEVLTCADSGMAVAIAQELNDFFGDLAELIRLGRILIIGKQMNRLSRLYLTNLGKPAGWLAKKLRINPEDQGKAVNVVNQSVHRLKRKLKETLGVEIRTKLGVKPLNSNKGRTSLDHQVEVWAILRAEQIKRLRTLSLKAWLSGIDENGYKDIADLFHPLIPSEIRDRVELRAQELVQARTPPLRDVA